MKHNHIVMNDGTVMTPEALCTLRLNKLMRFIVSLNFSSNTIHNSQYTLDNFSWWFDLYLYIENDIQK